MYCIANSSKYRALKVQEFIETDGSVVSGAMREYLFFRFFTPHPNVLTAKKSWRVKKNIYTLMPLYATTLTSLIKNDLPFCDFIYFLRHVCNGVKAMHDQSWLHRDLKMENILVDVKGVAIADFNLVRWACGEESLESPKWFRENATSHICTLWTRAPEVVLAEIQGKSRCEYGKEFDMFSLGSTFLAALVGDYVFGNLIKSTGSTDLIQYLTAFLDIMGTNTDIDKIYGTLTEGMPEFALRKNRIRDIILKPRYPPDELNYILSLIVGLLHPNPKERWTWTNVEAWFSTLDVPKTWSKKTVDTLTIIKTATLTKKYGKKPFDIEIPDSAVYRKGATLAKESFWNLCGISNIPPFITCEILRIKHDQAFSIQESQALLFILDCIHNYSGEVLCGQISYINPEDIWEVASKALPFHLPTLSLGVSLKKAPFKLCCLATELAITGKCEDPNKLEDSKLIYLSSSAPYFANYGSLWKSQAALRQTWFRLLTLNLA